jgi:small subunit ribosomal protein S2
MTLGGIREMGGLPDLVVVIDTIREDIAVKEAIKLKIPVVAIIDTNSCPDGITYPIPGNDDATKAIELYCDLFASAVLEGIQQGLTRTGVDIGASANIVEETNLRFPENDLAENSNDELAPQTTKE